MMIIQLIIIFLLYSTSLWDSILSSPISFWKKYQILEGNGIQQKQVIVRSRRSTTEQSIFEITWKSIKCWWLLTSLLFFLFTIFMLWYFCNRSAEEQCECDELNDQNCYDECHQPKKSLNKFHSYHCSDGMFKLDSKEVYKVTAAIRRAVSDLSQPDSTRNAILLNNSKEIYGDKNATTCMLAKDQSRFDNYDGDYSSCDEEQR